MIPTQQQLSITTAKVAKVTHLAGVMYTAAVAQLKDETENRDPRPATGSARGVKGKQVPLVVRLNDHAQTHSAHTHTHTNGGNV